MNKYVIAVDFDGTLFTDDYPEVGEPIWKTINYCKDKQKEGAILILWTCREGEDLVEAVELCKDVGLTFDYVNENAAQNRRIYYQRKIIADEYIDDKAINVRDLPKEKLEKYYGF